MDKQELICQRSFGEKLNELTSMVYEHTGELCSRCKWYLLLWSAVLAAVIEYFPAYNRVFGSVKVYLIALVVLLPVVLLTRWIDDHESVTTKNGGLRLMEREHWLLYLQCAFVMLLPALALSTVGGWLFETDATEYYEPLAIYMITTGKLLLLGLLMVPLFHIVTVSVLECKVGGEMLGRVWRILRYRTLAWMLYMGMVYTLGLLLPTIAEIPSVIIDTMREQFVKDVYEPTATDYGYMVIGYVSTLFYCAVYLLYSLFFHLATMLEYGNAVEHLDNVRFIEKLNNFDNL